MKAAFLALALVAVATAHTQEEIERKGREVMEEYRRDRGHWIFLNSQGMVDHMVDHMGANGLAVAGFFISKKHYRDAEPGEETQMKDPLFAEFKSLAKDQSWLDECCPGMSHKTWTFGYGHDKKIAQESGCDDIGTWLWEHSCVIVWKTSMDGTSLQTAHTVHFGHDHSKGIVPKPADIRKFVKEHAGKAVKTTSAEL
jgi:hypothetical protein